jgi:subtilisin family serine protease
VKLRITLLLCAVLVGTLVTEHVAGQPDTRAFIVVFRDDAPFRTFPPGIIDARRRANPAAWGYLNRSVLGAVLLLERQYDFRADHVYSATIRGFAARLTDEQVAGLRREPLVADIERDGAMQSFEQSLPWGIDRIDADQSSTRSGDGSGAVTNVNVYVLDNGVDRSHSDLNVINHVNFTAAANAATCAHGTRVSGVLAALDSDVGVVGVVPGAPITAVKVTTCDPVISSTSVAIKGIDWVTANAMRPAVANMSIGGFPSSTLDTAVKRSADRGIFYAIAAGNSRMDACFTSPQRVGTYPGVMTVAATTIADAEASFSNYGRCVDIWAPGADILTTDLGGSTVTSSGTSYAAPHVAGVAALYLSRNPTATATAVETALKNGAVFPGTLSRNGTPVRLVYAANY